MPARFCLCFLAIAGSMVLTQLAAPAGKPIVQKGVAPATQCNMAAWTSPLHFRVHAAYRTGTKFRTELQREDEQKWEWVIPKEEADFSISALSAGSDDKSPDKQTLDRATTGSNDSRLVPPRGSVAAMATCSVGVQTEDPVCGSLSLSDWHIPTTVTSPATQTLGDGRSPHQWRTIQEQYWLDAA